MARRTQQMFRQDNKANNNEIQPILQEIHDALYEVIKHHQSQSIITNRASTAKPVNGMERDKKTKKRPNEGRTKNQILSSFQVSLTTRSDEKDSHG